MRAARIAALPLTLLAAANAAVAQQPQPQPRSPVRSQPQPRGEQQQPRPRQEPQRPPQTALVAGSTSVRPVVDRLVTALRRTHADLRLVVEGGGSERGVCAVATGEAVIGMTSRGPQPQDVATWPELQWHRIGIDGISVVVHADNPVRGLTKDALRAIHLGRATDWRPFGGSGPILPFVATVQHGTFDNLTEFLELDGTESADHAAVTLRARGVGGGGFAVRTADGTRALLGSIVANGQAVACVSTAALDAMRARGAAMRPLALDGVDPTEANLRSGKYPFQRPLFLVTRGAPRGTAKLLVDLALSAEGQAVVRSLSFVPALVPAPQPAPPSVPPPAVPPRK